MRLLDGRSALGDPGVFWRKTSEASGRSPHSRVRSGAHPVFKGEDAFSEAYKVIQRFSEGVDLTNDLWRPLLGRAVQPGKLVAEIGTVFLCAIEGIADEDTDRNTQNWIIRL